VARFAPSIGPFRAPGTTTSTYKEPPTVNPNDHPTNHPSHPLAIQAAVSTHQHRRTWLWQHRCTRR